MSDSIYCKSANFGSAHVENLPLSFWLRRKADTWKMKPFDRTLKRKTELYSLQRSGSGGATSSTAGLCPSTNCNPDKRKNNEKSLITLGIQGNMAI